MPHRGFIQLLGHAELSTAPCSCTGVPRGVSFSEDGVISGCLLSPKASRCQELCSRCAAGVGQRGGASGTPLKSSHLCNRSLRPSSACGKGFVLKPNRCILWDTRITRRAGEHQAGKCLWQLLWAAHQESHSLVRAGLGLKTKSQGHLPSHLAKNTSQTSLLAAWCQQDLETLTELISALLSLAILVLSCLKGTVHLDRTGSCGSPLFTAEPAHSPECRRSSHCRAQPCLCSHLWQMRSTKVKGSTELQQLQRVHSNFKATRIKCWSCRQDQVLSNVSEVKCKCWLLVTVLPSSTLETGGDLLLSPADRFVSHPGAAGCWR